LQSSFDKNHLLFLTSSLTSNSNVVADKIRAIKTSAICAYAMLFGESEYDL